MSVLISPIVRLYINKRIANGLEDSSRKTERFGIPSKSRPDGSLIWIHAVSVGETISVLPLIDEFKKQNKNLHVLLTTTTLTAARMIEERCGTSVIHQFIPFDVSTWGRRFVKYWRPKAVFFVESELWPNILHILHEASIPAYMLNARVTSSTLKRMYMVQKIFKIAPYSLFRNVYVPTNAMRRHVQELGARDSIVIPNLKMLAPPLPVDEPQSKRLARKIGKRKVWIAVSTHLTEDNIIYAVHKKLKERHHDVLTILAIRHPARVADVIAACLNAGLTSACYTETITNAKQITEDIYILDKLGCLGNFFSVVDTVFVCGSLVPGIGGHNFLEPIKFSCNVATGEFIENFNDIYEHVAQWCKKLRSTGEITQFVLDSFANFSREARVAQPIDYESKWSEVVRSISEAVL
ncbi:MAG: hypothetical protein LBF56_01760 [Holosporales bacterium]|nr:hypothetical protein [Holosporales bacterium]